MLFLAACAAMVSPLGSAISGFWPFLLGSITISNVQIALRKPAEANDTGGLTLLHLQAPSIQKS
jgi:uncharacterized membrane protein YvlD (DUF360 family)